MREGSTGCVSGANDGEQTMTESTHGMLFVATDVDPADEDDFNRWYDCEHIEERARIEGFISAARYQSVQGPPTPQSRKYLGLYRTSSLDVFTSKSYQAAFGQQTAWSVQNLSRMRQPMRRVCAVTAVAGQGSGCRLSVLSLSGSLPPASLQNQAAAAGVGLAALAGFVHCYLLRPDPALSSPLPNETLQGRELQPMFVIETGDEAADRLALQTAEAIFAIKPGQAARYALRWKLYSHELPPSLPPSH